MVVVSGSGGIGCHAALDVIDRGGSAVIIGRSKGLVGDTVALLAGRRGQAREIAAELTWITGMTLDDRSTNDDLQPTL
jgi:hypothetical protein